jgi:hypothetical protein
VQPLVTAASRQKHTCCRLPCHPRHWTTLLCEHDGRDKTGDDTARCPANDVLHKANYTLPLPSMRPLRAEDKVKERRIIITTMDMMPLSNGDWLGFIQQMLITLVDGESQEVKGSSFHKTTTKPTERALSPQIKWPRIEKRNR